MNMLDALHNIELLLPVFLTEIERWEPVLLSDRKPVVHRLRSKWSYYEICLDKIYPSDTSSVPLTSVTHPFSSRVLQGNYEIRWSHNAHPVDVFARIIVEDNNQFEVLRPDVRMSGVALGYVAYVLTVKAPPFATPLAENFEPLPSPEAIKLLDMFRQYYPPMEEFSDEGTKVVRPNTAVQQEDGAKIMRRASFKKRNAEEDFDELKPKTSPKQVFEIDVEIEEDNSAESPVTLGRLSQESKGGDFEERSDTDIVYDMGSTRDEFS